ncbi:MAG: hypothetical protein CME51_04400 [Halieaceae bacterium]|nr:hypothetical protein [Halieaceae bacterium]|tara:strand:- start:57 stop:359 length:303 start_codon:yes stop_codon:yes gene_type:complete
MYLNLGNSLSYTTSGRKRRKLPAKKKTKPKFEKYVPKPTYVRETPDYPSVSSAPSADSCAKAERVEYTGTLIKGISTMHKSNAVPIINQQEAEDIAKMRR